MYVPSYFNSFYFFFNQDADYVMEEPTKREELENRCMEQAAKIEQLNQLVTFFSLVLDLNDFLLHNLGLRFLRI